MKSFTRKTFQGSFLVLCIGTLLAFGIPAQAEMSPREYEAHLVQKKRDFQKYLNERLQASESERNAAIAMRESRERDLRAQNEIERRYREQMKRYSMEEVEARDRADEKRLELELMQGETLRRDFIARRDRLRELDLAISPVDEMKEFDIDMTKEPDFKSSYPSPEMQNQGTENAE